MIYILNCGYKNVYGSTLSQLNALTQLDAKQRDLDDYTKIIAGDYTNSNLSTASDYTNINR